MLSYDRPWWAGISFTFSILEPNLCLITGCIVTFSPLLSMRPRKESKASDWTYDVNSPTSRRKSSAVGQAEKSYEGQIHDEVPPPQLGYNAAPENGIARQNSVLLSLSTDVPRFTADPTAGSEDTLVRQQSYESAGNYNYNPQAAYQSGGYPNIGAAGSYYEQMPYSAGQPTYPAPTHYQYQQQAGPDMSWQYQQQAYTQDADASYAHPQNNSTTPQTEIPMYSYVYTPGQPTQAEAYHQTPLEQYQYQYQNQYQTSTSREPASAVSPTTVSYLNDSSAYGYATAPSDPHAPRAVSGLTSGYEGATQNAAPSTATTRDMKPLPETPERGIVSSNRAASHTTAAPAAPHQIATVYDATDSTYDPSDNRSLSNSTEPYSGVSSNFTNFADDDAPFDLGGLQALSEAQARTQRRA